MLYFKKRRSMKKLISVLVFFLVSTLIFYSCSDNSVVGTGSSGPIKAIQNFQKETPPVFINIGIPTNDYLNAGDTGAVSAMIFHMDSIVSVDVTKLDIILSHNGTNDTLVHNLTNPGNNFIGTVFSDDAATPIQNGSGDYTGLFKPYKPLSIFDGANLNGVWNLIINYWGNNRTGVIKSWGITLTYNVTNSGNNIFPFVQGNYWIFKDSLYNGTITYDTLQVTGKSSISGKDVYWWKWRNSTRIYYVRGENNGVYNYGNNFDSASYLNPYLWFKYPVNQGEFWYSKYWLLIRGVDTINCVSLNESFGGFTECIKYSVHNSDTTTSDNVSGLFSKNLLKVDPQTSYYAEYYFKPGIGYVGADIYVSGSFWFRLYCTHYIIN